MSNKPKLQSFRKSVANLKSILVESKTGIVRDAAIKRYELCYELSWKSVQEALRNEGLEICKSPKGCFKQAFKLGWIEEEEAYADMVQNRNLTTHIPIASSTLFVGANLRVCPVFNPNGNCYISILFS